MKLELPLLLLYLLSFLTKGKPSSLPYPVGEERCRNRSTEYKPTGLNLCCSKCRPGSRLESVCTPGKDTVCKECEEGTFSDAMSYHTNCFTCSECKSKGLTYSKPCTRSSNAVCECMSGYYCFFYEGNGCSTCRLLTKCPPGKGALPKVPLRNIRCADCPEGTFSNETSSDPCKNHTDCKSLGMVVLKPGSSEADAECLIPIPEVLATIQTTSHTSSSSDIATTPSLTSVTTYFTEKLISPSDGDTSITYLIVVGAVAGAAVVLVLLTVTFIICHRKGLWKPPIQEAEVPVQALDNQTESEHLLADGKKDTTSSSSSSSDSQSQCTGASLDSIHTEQPMVSSPCVNVSITATFNCHVNPNNGTCSIPISQTVMPEVQLPLSQEEQLRVSCEEENTKDHLQSVQESGMSVF
ncbi:tumor necrosis factor receptor superfamily member 1B isoform X2 [Hoplias malabaricus]|uniref:tumor necrosis factor receptor superfamily member 1B isoform X2 n=1 Tax=Hoplias malabaricus TaxID=27720 RepID=UPI0034621985